MYITQITEHRYHLHKSGRRASIYGAAPWYSDAEKADWTTVSNGYQFHWSDNTVGHLPTAPTKEEAIERANKINRRMKGYAEDQRKLSPDMGMKAFADSIPLF